MKDQLQTIREALTAAANLIAHQYTGTSLGMTALQDASDDCLEALTALAQLEAMAGEPVALIVRNCCEAEKADPDHPDTICISVQDLTAILKQYAAPVSQQYEAGDMASAAAQGFRDGVASVTQQEQVAWQSIESMATQRYRVVPSRESMFYRHAVVAGDGTQQLYHGREVECENMARKFAGAFLDGAYAAQNYAAPVAQQQEPVKPCCMNFAAGTNCFSDPRIDCPHLHPVAQQQQYDQTALELCAVCGWKTLIPGDCCLNCERNKAQQPQAEPDDEILKERDDAEDYIDMLLDEVLGTDRPEWTSAYGRDDALRDVQERMTALHKPTVDKAWARFEKAQQPQAEVARLREALQAIVQSWDNNTFCRERFVKSELGDYWAPTSAMVNSETIAAARAALKDTK